jgi:hypothetical protein
VSLQITQRGSMDTKAHKIYTEAALREERRLRSLWRQTCH